MKKLPELGVERCCQGDQFLDIGQCKEYEKVLVFCVFIITNCLKENDFSIGEEVQKYT